MHPYACSSVNAPLFIICMSDACQGRMLNTVWSHPIYQTLKLVENVCLCVPYPFGLDPYSLHLHFGSAVYELLVMNHDTISSESTVPLPHRPELRFSEELGSSAITADVEVVGYPVALPGRGFFEP